VRDALRDHPNSYVDLEQLEIRVDSRTVRRARPSSPKPFIPLIRTLNSKFEFGAA
jgi:hypothetical protein